METLDKYFRELTGASFAKRGRAAGELISQWPAIVGERLAAICSPERVKWPKGPGSEQDGGTLVLRSIPGRALDVSHEAELIITRMNAFLGYRAIGKLKIVQGHTAPASRKRPALPPLAPGTAKALEEKLATIADDRLKDALKRLGMGALVKAPGSPQSK